VAALLSLPIEAEASNGNVCLENFRNKLVYLDSFTVNQKDMLASAMRVTGTKEADWAITTESSSERYATGIEEMKEGKKIGFAKMMYTRVFYPDGTGNLEQHENMLNKVLKLPKEDIDEATRAAIERSKEPLWTA